jgi:Family of unknown function (DUF5681)
MRFIPGQSGNPAGRPPGSLNKKTLALEAAFEARAEEIVENVMDRAKDGQPAAMRLCMERLVPTGRNRPIAIDLPVIKTPDDAEAALAVVTAELAAGNLTAQEASSLISLIDRMLRLAERIWKMKKIRAVLDDEPAGESDEDAAAAPQEPAPGLAAGGATPAEGDTEGHGEAAAPLYSPVNLAADEAAEAIEPTGGPPAHIGPGDNGPPADAHGPPADADQAMPPQRAAA